MGIRCFVIMPFREEFEAVFAAVDNAARSALPDQAIDCYWLKDVLHAGRITDDILAGLREATFCIADVTENNPNVMWETGYAMALGKPTLLIGQHVEQLPFDLKDQRVVPYQLEDLGPLEGTLREAVRQTLARYELGPASRPASRAVAASQSLAVTGTRRADTARLCRRVETTLRPYLSAKAVWYTGSAGDVDECVARYLVQNSQQVIAVGYNRYDCSGPMRELVTGGKVDFVDASVEALPKQLPGPSQRDILFAIKAELVILFWDGKSSGTAALLHYFREAGKSLLTAFI